MDIAILPPGLPAVPGVNGEELSRFWLGPISPADAAFFLEIDENDLLTAHHEGRGPTPYIPAHGVVEFKRADLWKWKQAEARP
jgi:hypothetical protein